MAEVKDFMDDIRNDKYRFAHDLVTEVLMLRGEGRPSTYPLPNRVLFTKDHAKLIENFLLSDQVFYLDKRIKEITRDRYDCHTYATCRQVLINEFTKNVPYSEENFICVCAVVAYIAAYFRKRKVYRVTNDSIEYIRVWITRILSRGLTLKYSSW
ncbi:hypothetical protein AVEN_70263-1 [Araneus ventricosus]|uniref:Uncharacterized protein n=1 Tax=Araneus ventricosus TaxID=182803 RepID=A0A4Y2GF43_ARAVE|nr:hypothetical protein AVEN_70263-1 [Araneus ventricosus]